MKKKRTAEQSFNKLSGRECGRNAKHLNYLETVNDSFFIEYIKLVIRVISLSFWLGCQRNESFQFEECDVGRKMCGE